MLPRQQENTAVMEETFSTLSEPMGYKQDELAIEVRELLGFSSCELLLLEASS
jgi:hypothetical protein